MVTVAIVAVMLTIAIPSLREMTLGTGTLSRVNDLLGHLNTARAEAVKNATNVRITAAGGGWNDGWVVATDRNMNGAIDGDDELLKEGSKLNTGFNWTVTAVPGGATTQFFYNASGVLTTANAGMRFKLERPDKATFPDRCKIIVVAPSGRAESQKGSVAQCAA